MKIRDILDIIMPRTCSICGQRLDVQEDVLCTPCFMHLPHTGFLDNPYENEMAKVFWGRIRNFEKAFAFIYHKAHADSARPIYELKYNGKPDIGFDLGLIMGRMMNDKDFFNDIDAIIPVPLAEKRKKSRGYNQSELIADGFHHISNIPIYNNVVKRNYFEESQTHKDRWDRAENVENAFMLIDGSKIRGKHLLIVDDVVTTGATVTAIARQLQRMEDVHISVAAISFAKY